MNVIKKKTPQFLLLLVDDACTALKRVLWSDWSAVKNVAICHCFYTASSQSQQHPHIVFIEKKGLVSIL